MILKGNLDGFASFASIYSGPDFLEYRLASGGHCIEIIEIQVSTQRRKGTGRALIRKLVEILPPHVTLVIAITRSSNFIAQQFYEACKFRVVGVLRNFYYDGTTSDNVDAIMYGLNINAAKQL